MTDSGLSTRLRQQSRRAGLMVGITMVLAIAICIFGAAGLFAWLSRPFSDLIPVVAPAAQVQSTAAPDEPTGQPPAQGDRTSRSRRRRNRPSPHPRRQLSPRPQTSSNPRIRSRRPVGQFPYRTLDGRFGDRCLAAGDAVAVPGRRRTDLRIRTTVIAGCASAPRMVRRAGSWKSSRSRISRDGRFSSSLTRAKKASYRRCNVC